MKKRPSVPDYAAASRATRRYTRAALREGCEICGSSKRLYVFTIKGKGKKIRRSCRKHLRKVK